MMDMATSTTTATTTPKKSTGNGTTAFISTDGTTYKTLASVSKISAPNMSRGTVDVTDLNSFSNNAQMKEFLVDFIEADTMTIEGFVVSTDEGREDAESAFYTGSTCYIKIVLPSAIGKTMIVTGLLTAFRAIGDIDTSNGIAYSLSLKPSSKPQMTTST
jgi:hypothetical protein